VENCIVKSKRRRASKTNNNAAAKMRRTGNGPSGSVSKSKQKTKLKPIEVDHTPCQFCGKRYNTEEDEKLMMSGFSATLVKCGLMKSCAEQHGIIGDDVFICENCVA
jgi:hypothetical protein